MSDRILICCLLLAILGCREETIAPSVNARRDSDIDAGNTLHATRDETVIEIQPSRFRFTIPNDWLDWHDQFGNNLHLTVSEINAVQHGKGEWDTEYAKVSNAIFPFERCAAHVGSEGWGSDAVAFSDLQVRVYDLNESADTIDTMIDRQGTSTVTKLTQKESKIDRSTQDGWRRALLKYPRFYHDYGATAHVDVRFRQFGSRTIAFVFMYTDYQSQAAAISTMLGSLTAPDIN